VRTGRERAAVVIINCIVVTYRFTGSVPGGQTNHGGNEISLYVFSLILC